MLQTLLHALLSGVGVVIGFYLMSLGFGLWRFLSRRKDIAAFTSGMESGIYIEHGMTIDPATGLVTPQQRPSIQAYRHLI